MDTMNTMKAWLVPIQNILSGGKNPNNHFFSVINLFHRGLYGPPSRRPGGPIASQGGSVPEFLRKPIANPPPPHSSGSAHAWSFSSAHHKVGSHGDQYLRYESPVEDKNNFRLIFHRFCYKPQGNYFSIDIRSCRKLFHDLLYLMNICCSLSESNIRKRS